MLGNCHPAGAQLMLRDSLSPETTAATHRWEVDVLGQVRMGSEKHKGLGHSLVSSLAYQT